MHVVRRKQLLPHIYSIHNVSPWSTLTTSSERHNFLSRYTRTARTLLGQSRIEFKMFTFLLVLVSAPLICVISGTMLLAAYVYVTSFFPGKDCEESPTLYYKDSLLAKYILLKCTRLTQPFRPTYWAQNAHVQTILPAVLPRARVSFEREFLQMKDRGIVALDWTTTRIRRLRRYSPIVIFIPELTGDAYSMSNICLEGIRRGLRCVVFNKRGHGGSPITTQKLQSFGDPRDFREVVKYIRSRYPEAKLTAVGASAGSGLLLSYLGEYGSSTFLTAGVCISPAYDVPALFNSGDHVGQQPYHKMMLYNLKRIFSRHASALVKTADVDSVMKASTLAQYEESVQCKMHGFKSMDDYWEGNNPMRDVDDISVPVLCLNSKDDPICGEKNIPMDLFKLYPNFCLALTERGGHCGFLEGNSSPDSWADKVAIDYLKVVLEFASLHNPRQF